MNMDQEETIDERYCFDDEDILSIADLLGFTIPDESIEPMKRKFNSLWKDKTKETNKKLLEKENADELFLIDVFLILIDLLF